MSSETEFQYPHWIIKFKGTVAPLAFGAFSTVSLMNWYYSVGIPPTLTIYPALAALSVFIIGGIVGSYLVNRNSEGPK